MSERRRLRPSQRLGRKEIAALLASTRALRLRGLSVVLRANAAGLSRLGLIVPKRVLPRAVDRNRAKRVLREWFRVRQQRLGSRDLLIRVTARDIQLEELDRHVAIAS